MCPRGEAQWLADWLEPRSAGATIGSRPDFHRWPLTPDGVSLCRNGFNEGKKSVAIDLSSSEGRDSVTALIAPPGGDRGRVAWSNADIALRLLGGNGNALEFETSHIARCAHSDNIREISRNPESGDRA